MVDSFITYENHTPPVRKIDSSDIGLKSFFGLFWMAGTLWTAFGFVLGYMHFVSWCRTSLCSGVSAMGCNPSFDFGSRSEANPVEASGQAGFGTRIGEVCARFAGTRRGYSQADIGKVIGAA